tara:strand:- start:2676 stop:2807 length:132 start_codon:yes stop_codon:yes gene_type:complete
MVAAAATLPIGPTCSQVAGAGKVQDATNRIKGRAVGTTAMGDP